MKKPSRNKTRSAHAGKQRTQSKQRKTKRARRAAPITARRRQARRHAHGRMNAASLQGTRRMVKAIFDADVHAKRVESLANGATGVMLAARAAIHAIGAAYAEVAEIKPKHGVKQVDRYLSNKGIDVETLTSAWIEFVLGSRREALIALDWTEFDADDHATLCAYLVTTHGRATPLCWQTVRKLALGNGLRTDTEVAQRAPLACHRTRGRQHAPGRSRLWQSASLSDARSLGWHYVIRFRSNITVTHAGESKPARA